MNRAEQTEELRIHPSLPTEQNTLDKCHPLHLIKI